MKNSPATIDVEEGNLTTWHAHSNHRSFVLLTGTDEESTVAMDYMFTIEAKRQAWG